MSVQYDDADHGDGRVQFGRVLKGLLEVVLDVGCLDGRLDPCLNSQIGFGRIKEHVLCEGVGLLARLQRPCDLSGGDLTAPFQRSSLYSTRAPILLSVFLTSLSLLRPAGHHAHLQRSFDVLPCDAAAATSSQTAPKAACRPAAARGADTCQDGHGRFHSRHHGPAAGLQREWREVILGELLVSTVAVIEELGAWC